MDYRILYHPRVDSEDIPILPDTIKRRVKRAIDGRLATYPDLYGKPLRKGLHRFRKLRIGDWRIVYRIDDKDVIIFIIAHRAKIYQHVFERV